MERLHLLLPNGPTLDNAVAFPNNGSPQKMSQTIQEVIQAVLVVGTSIMYVVIQVLTDEPTNLTY